MKVNKKTVKLKQNKTKNRMNKIKKIWKIETKTKKNNKGKPIK